MARNHRPGTQAFRNACYNQLLVLEREEALTDLFGATHKQVITDSLGPMEDYRQTRYAAELWEANAKGAMSTVIELKAKIDAAIRILQG